MALYRKYRPATFAEVVGQQQVTKPLSAALDAGRINHAYLFSGPRGCGKTSSARIMARSLNCVEGPTSTPCGVCDSCRSLAPGGPGNLDVTELDAASHNGVEDMRELRDRAYYAPAESRYRIFIIDEAHMISNAGSNALLKVVEEPPEHLIFIFATTEPEKVIGTIRSRTHHYPFRLLTPPAMRGLLERTVQAEGVQVEDAVYPLVIQAGGGSPRDTLSILDQLLAGAGADGLTYDLARPLLGVTDVTLLDNAVEALANNDKATMFRLVGDVIDAGHEPRRFATDLLDRLRDLLVLQVVPDAFDAGLVDAPTDRAEALTTQAKQFNSERLTQLAAILNEEIPNLRGATSPRLLLEILCARMLIGVAQSSAGAAAAPAAPGSSAAGTTATGGAGQTAPAGDRNSAAAAAQAAAAAAAAARRGREQKSDEKPGQSQVRPQERPQEQAQQQRAPQPQPEQSQPEQAPTPTEEKQPDAGAQQEAQRDAEGRREQAGQSAQPAQSEQAAQPEQVERPGGAPGTQAESQPGAQPKTQSGQQPESQQENAPEQPERSASDLAETIRENWTRVRQEVGAKNKVAEIMLTEARVLGIKDATLMLGHTTGALAERLNAPSNNEPIVEVLNDSFGAQLKVKCVIGTDPTAVGLSAPREPKPAWNPHKREQADESDEESERPAGPAAPSEQKEPTVQAGEVESAGGGDDARGGDTGGDDTASGWGQPRQLGGAEEPEAESADAGQGADAPRNERSGLHTGVHRGDSESAAQDATGAPQDAAAQQPATNHATPAAKKDAPARNDWQARIARAQEVAEKRGQEARGATFSNGVPLPPEPDPEEGVNAPPPDSEYAGDMSSVPSRGVGPSAGGGPAGGNGTGGNAAGGSTFGAAPSPAGQSQSMQPTEEEQMMAESAARETGEHDHRSATEVAVELLSRELGAKPL